jgi:hypothetical protein
VRHAGSRKVGIESTQHLGLEPLDIELQDGWRREIPRLTERVARVDGELNRPGRVVPRREERMDRSLRVTAEMHRQSSLDLTETDVQDLDVVALIRPRAQSLEARGNRLKRDHVTLRTDQVAEQASELADVGPHVQDGVALVNAAWRNAMTLGS